MSQLPQQTVESLEKSASQISQIVESLIELGVLVHDFQGNETSLKSLAVTMNQTIQQLGTLSTDASTNLKDLPIPLDVLQYIEDGRNPNVYTREFVEATKKSNQHLRGKMLALKQLRDVLGGKIEQEFPELKEEIHEIYKKTD